MNFNAAADGSSLGSDGRSTSEQVTAFAEFAENESRDVLSFYEVEAQILALYDHLNEINLEIALLEVRNRLPSSKRLENLCIEAFANSSMWWNSKRSLSGW